MNEDNSEYKHRLEVLKAAGYEHLYFSFWQSYYEQGQELPDLKMRCAFYEAILRFGLIGLPERNVAGRMAQPQGHYDAFPE